MEAEFQNFIPHCRLIFILTCNCNFNLNRIRHINFDLNCNLNLNLTAGSILQQAQGGTARPGFHDLGRHAERHPERHACGGHGMGSFGEAVAVGRHPRSVGA